LRYPAHPARTPPVSIKTYFWGLGSPFNGRPPADPSSTSWVRAPASGILRTQIPLGCKIAVNQKIGEIADPFDEHETAVNSLVAGIVIGRMNLPLVHKGDALFHVAGFDDSAAISESLDEFKEEISESIPAPTGS